MHPFYITQQPHRVNILFLSLLYKSRKGTVAQRSWLTCPSLEKWQLWFEPQSASFLLQKPTKEKDTVKQRGWKAFLATGLLTDESATNSHTNLSNHCLTYFNWKKENAHTFWGVSRSQSLMTLQWVDICWFKELLSITVSETLADPPLHFQLLWLRRRPRSAQQCDVMSLTGVKGPRMDTGSEPSSLRERWAVC